MSSLSIAEPANVQESTSTNPVATGIDLRSSTELLEAIRANFIPSFRSELHLLSQCISDAERDVQRCDEGIQRCDEEIQKLRAKLDSLQKERNERCRQFHRYRSLLAPIRRLFPELLSRIFWFACPKTRVTGDGIDCSVIRVSQVCARWREVARSTSTLWSSFHIDLDVSRYGIEVIEPMITTHLELSRNSPLSFALTAFDQSPKLQCVVDAIVPHSFRWKEVELIGRPFILDSMSSVKGSLPQLRSLSIDLLEGDNTRQDLFEMAPRLQALSLRSPRREFLLECVVIPFTQIIDFTVEYGSYSSALAQLRALSAVRNLKVNHCWYDENMTSVAPITLHNMSSVSMIIPVQFDNDLNNGSLRLHLDRLTLPNLEVLRLETVLPRHDSLPLVRLRDVTELPDFVKRSSCVIRTLILANIGLNDNDTLSIVRNLPTLQNLMIHDWMLPYVVKHPTITNHLIRQLTIDPVESSSPRLLPHLKTLNLRPSVSFLLKAFVDMVQSRWIPNQIYSDELGVDSLTSVTLHLIRSLKDELENELEEGLEPLRAMESAGLCLKLSTDW
ncbi:hypothetical protein K435DRAFT_964703 [Dendrothele bispora CBS 962.96]|uniref:Uncharacterized protein n=1 Tax=Dendrothele bispora (strain CBS 962.96) TaxID=1314807 RepID=A0A4S8M965_DENBC|nr:hypothetical protein K435DRAFT_964703 [Dendrothele bispora CBS 962.96]